MNAVVQRYYGGRDGEVADLVLSIQNDEVGLCLTIDDEPDLFDIANAYADGGFWIALPTPTPSTPLAGFCAGHWELRRWAQTKPVRLSGPVTQFLFGKVAGAIRQSICCVYRVRYVPKDFGV